VVGVWTHLCDNVQDYVHSLRDMVTAIEADHVGIGTDTDMTSGKGLPQTDKAWPGLNEGFFYVVLAEMRRQKFTAQEIEKIAGGNYLRVFAASTAKA
jgi:microsomal dipeptidase-like Zn-dependent dipeptidase